jgi:MoxR-like ATPase
MEERQISIERETLTLPRPFMVIATQNPVELEGTFPLPEAQMDRFLMRLRLNYPAKDEERLILQRFKEEQPLQELKPVVDAETLSALQHVIRTIHVSAGIENYIVDMVHATREHSEVELGVSPRGTLALYRAAQALAATQNRNHVIPDDVKQLAPHILSHRMIATSQSRLHGHDMMQVISDILKQTAVPVEP